MMKKDDASKFFETLKFRDIEKIRKFLRILSLFFCFMMFAVAVLAILFAWSVTMKPAPVIAFDKEGKRTVFYGSETLESSTNLVRVHRFISDFFIQETF